MKKILLACHLLLGAVLLAQVSYTQDWTATGLNSWTGVSGGGSFSRITNAAQICGTTAGTIRSEQYYGTTGQFTSPALTGNNEGMITMAFDYKITDYYAPTTGATSGTVGMIKVEYASSATGPWVTAHTIDSSNHVVAGTCATKTVTFNPSAGDLFVRFNITSASSADVYYYFDNVAISQGAAPTCSAPSNVVASGVTLNSANIAWTAPASVPASGYEYYLSTSSTSPVATTPATNTSATNSLPLSGLPANTTHYLWVRSVCSTTDKSAWTTAATFTTPCVSVGIPYSLDFSTVTVPALPDCTMTVNDGSGNVWTTYNLNSGGFDGNVLNYIYNGANAANTWFYTDGINLTAGTNYRIKYKYGNASGATYPEKLKVAYGTDRASSAMNTVLANYPNVVNTTANSVFVDFTPPSTGVYYFGFQAYSNADMNRLYVDDINVDLAPTCGEPSAVTASAVTTNSATVGWAAPPTVPANGYEIYYSNSNTPPTSSTTATLTGITGNSQTLTPLAEGTQYFVWLRSVCSTTENSAWTTMTTFTTLFTPPTNDNCSAPTLLTAGSSFDQNPFTGTTVGATTTTDATATHTCQPTAYKETWYTVTVPAGGNLTIETKSATGSLVTDTVLGVYTGSCGNLVQVGCDDDTSDDGNFSKVVLTGQTPGTVLLISVWNYSNSTNGTYRVSAYDALDPTLATSEVKSNQDLIKAYPNPFTDVLTISDVKNVKSIVITDMAGKTVRTFNKAESTLYLNDLNAGMYFVILNMNDGSKQTIKAIKR